MFYNVKHQTKLMKTLTIITITVINYLEMHTNIFVRLSILSPKNFLYKLQEHWHSFISGG